MWEDSAAGSRVPKEQGRAFLGVWANVVRLTRPGLGREHACGQPQALCSNSGYRLMRWDAVDPAKSGLVPENQIGQWYMA